MKTSALQVCLLFCLLFSGTHVDAKEQIRILMIGNSYTRSGSSSQQTSTNLIGFFNADSEIDAVIQTISPGGRTLIAHWDDGSTTNSNTAPGRIVLGGPWDYVILQDQSQMASFDSYYSNTGFEEGVDNFVPLIRSVGAKPILMSTWGRNWALGSGIGGTVEESREIHLDHTSFSYATLAHKWSVKAAPCGEAVEYFERDPAVPYTYAPNRRMDRDGSHLNSRGGYIAAAAIYHTITAKDPGAVNFAGPVEGGNFNGLAPGEGKILCDSFNRMIAAFDADPSLPELATFSNGPFGFGLFADGSRPAPFYPDPDPTAVIVGDATPGDKAMTVDVPAGITAGVTIAQVQATPFTPIAVPFSNSSSNRDISSVVTPTSSMTYAICAGNDDGAFSVSASGVVSLTQTASIPVPRVLHVRATDSNNWHDDVLLTIKQSSGHAPLLFGSDMTDDQPSGLALINSAVTYTLNFSEAMNASTVGVSDFSNTGSASMTVNSVAQISPSVFRVVVTPTSVGTLQLRVTPGSVLRDLDAEALDTGSEIADDTVLSIDLGPQTVPNVVGQTQAVAEANLVAANLLVGDIFLQSDPSIPLGEVFGQGLAAGAVVDDGVKVNLVVSNGPVAVSSEITIVDFREGLGSAVGGETTLLSGYDASDADKLVVVLGSEGAIRGRFNGVTYGGVALTEAVQVEEVGELQKAAIFYLDDPGVAGDVVVDLGSLSAAVYTVYQLKGTVPGIGSSSAALSNSVTFTTTAPGSFVIAGLANAGPNGGNGGGYPVGAAPLTSDNQTELKIGNRNVTFGSGSATVPAVGTTQAYSFSGAGGTDLLAVVAAEFMAETFSSVPPGDFVVTYFGNENSEGEAPRAEGKFLGVNLILSDQESLERIGYTFLGWNTAMDGGGLSYLSGASYAAEADVMLFAEWSRNPLPLVSAGPDQSLEWQSVTAAPGLHYGAVVGDINLATPNPQTSILTDISVETENSIAGNTTEIYTGSIYDADGQISFTEHIDDKSRIWIDGGLVLSDDNWRNRVSTPNLNLAPGWHTFEIRISNGSGGSGPVDGFGIAYDPDGGTAWQSLVDPGDGSFLRADQNMAGAQVVLGGTVSGLEGLFSTTVWSLVEGPGVVTFDNASAAGATASFTMAGTYTLLLTVDDGVVLTTDEVEIVVNPPLSAVYTAWAGGVFENPFTEIGAILNGDGDGMSNMMEFAFGTDPTVNDGGPLAMDGSVNGRPVLASGVDGALYDFVFVRRDDHGDSGSLIYTIEFTGDLDTYFDNLVVPVLVADSDDDSDYEVVRVPFPALLPNGQVPIFGRVKAEVAP